MGKLVRKMVDLKKIEVPGPGDPFYVEIDGDLQRLLRDVMVGEKPSRSVWTRVSDLRVHDERALAGARAALAEYPGLVASRRAEREQVPAWSVYRDSDGALVVFDDYAPYVVAVADKVEWTPVTVLGEAAPVIEAKGGSHGG